MKSIFFAGQNLLFTVTIYSNTWMKVFRINPKFRILMLTFH